MSFINDLLYIIDELGEMLPQTKGNYRSISSMHMPTYYKSLSRLKDRGLVKVQNNSKKQKVYILTEKGRAMLKKPTDRIRRQDGFSTIVLFDIPQDKSRERNIFRRFLIRNGYTLIQRSVLASPDKPSKEIFDLIRELEISGNVKMLSGKFEYFKMK